MRILSLWQPWASWWASGEKVHETRSWATAYRGLVAIHAAKKKTPQLVAVQQRLDMHLPLGAVLGYGTLTACYQTDFTRHAMTSQEIEVGDWSDGRWAWKLENVQQLDETIPLRGQQGPTSDVTVSAHVGTNSDVFPCILDLHVPAGSVVADVTYGKGIFWQKVAPDLYKVLPSDIATGTDCRDLPYADGTIDCVVLDPPYMEGFYRKPGRSVAGRGTYSTFRRAYSNGTEEAANGPHAPKYQEAVTALYVEAGHEAKRVLRDRGIFIVKCQDAVCANRQHLTHVEIINAYSEMGFYAKDLFVLVRSNRPAISRLIQQRHARKNHSYFIVMSKEVREA